MECRGVVPSFPFGFHFTGSSHFSGPQSSLAFLHSQGAAGTRDQELVPGRVSSANVQWNDWGNSLLTAVTEKQNKML